MPRYASSSSAVGVLESTATSALDWELLYDLHAARLRRIIQRKVGPAMTEDVLQETFLRAFRNRHTLDATRPIGPWLITIALRAATDVQRRQLRTIDAELVDEPCEDSGFGAVEEELLRRARALGIKHALASLNPKQRRMLEAVAVDGVAYEQLARSEDMSSDAVKSVIARARTNFRSSYFSFGRSTDLFGGLVGAAIWRLRSRFQRYQALVGDHAAAFGATAITVVAVGIAAYPAARPLPTEAAEMTEVVNAVAFALGDSPPLPIAELSGLEAGVTASGASSIRGSENSGTASSDRDVTIRTQGHVRNDGVQTSAGLSATTSTETADTRTYAGMTIDCTEGRLTRVECHVVDLAGSIP